MQGPSSYNNVVANSVIIVGPNGEFLMYSGSVPALNQLLASIVPTNTVDSVNNNLLGGGFAAYGLVGGVDYFATTVESNAIVMQRAAAQNGSYLTKASMIFSNQFTTPGLLIKAATSGAGILFADGSQRMIAIGPILAQNPASAQTPDTWHNLSLSGSWTAATGQTPQYILRADNTVELRGQAIVPAGVTGPANTVGVVPAAYVPGRNQPIPTVDTAPASPFTATAHALTIRATSGNVDVFGAATAGNILTLNCRYPLEA